jgi:purine-binding chemotaxis protein CheW
MATIEEKSPASLRSLGAIAGKYLTFTLGGESYGIPVLRVREIIRLTGITAVPEMPEHIRGVINLRGKIIPVMDLRRRFGFAETESTEQNCIVVVQVQSKLARAGAMGLIVDAVEEVAQFAASDIEETPDFGSQVTTDCLLGMAKVKGLVKALLNIDRVIGVAAETLPAGSAEMGR